MSDPVAIATEAAHGAALAVFLADGAGHRMDAQQEVTFGERWPNFGEPSPGQAAPEAALAAYVCGRKEPVSGEQLFRKAAELGVHSCGRDGFADLPKNYRLAYEVFAATAGNVFRSFAGPEPGRKVEPQKIDPEDMIFEGLDDPLDRDLDAVAALERRTAPAIADALQVDLEEAIAAVAEPAAPAKPRRKALSAGEAPARVRPAQKRGGARPKKEEAADGG